MGESNKSMITSKGETAEGVGGHEMEHQNKGTKEDREARRAVWPKNRARKEGLKTMFINGQRDVP